MTAAAGLSPARLNRSLSTRGRASARHISAIMRMRIANSSQCFSRSLRRLEVALRARNRNAGNRTRLGCCRRIRWRMTGSAVSASPASKAG